MIRLLALVAFVACSGSSSLLEPVVRCTGGVLRVPAPVAEFRARYPVVSATYRCTPRMHFGDQDGGCQRGDGCFVFVPGEVATAYTVEAKVYATGEPLCPYEVEVTP